MVETKAQVPATLPPLVTELAAKYGLEPNRFTTVLRETYFKTSEATPLSTSEIAAGLILCKKYDLDPFTREIHVTRAKGRLLVMVGIDGWIRIAQRTGQLDGIEFEEQFNEEGKIESVKAKVHRKDQAHPTIITAYMEEYGRDTDPWRTMPIRMLRHKAAKEALRYAFGIGGLDDEEPDEVIPVGPPVRKSRSLNLEKPELESVVVTPEVLPEPREPGAEG